MRLWINYCLEKAGELMTIRKCQMSKIMSQAKSSDVTFVNKKCATAVRHVSIYEWTMEKLHDDDGIRPL